MPFLKKDALERKGKINASQGAISPLVNSFKRFQWPTNKRVKLVVSEKKADNYCSDVIKLINGLGLHIRKGEKNGAEIYRSHVSIKASALCSDFKSDAFE